jgi:6-phosphogluconolactonase
VTIRDRILLDSLDGAHNAPSQEFLSPRTAAKCVMTALIQTYQAHGSCSVMLTGGRSATKLYDVLSALPEFLQLRNVHFFFGDERCVPPDSPESNYCLAMRSLFKYGIPATCKVTRMDGDQVDRDAAAWEYERQLPTAIDILLLSMGEDGHIASLFPGSPALCETHRRVLPVTSPKPPFERLTITPCVITQAQQVFLMAFGERKAAVYERAKLAPSDISELPARLVLNATWFLDSQTDT